MSETRLVNRNLRLNGRRTSVRFEPEYWDALGEIARTEACSISELAKRIDKDVSEGTLTSAMRVYVLRWYQERVNA